MKKIISRYYLFIAFLLVIADQKFSGLVLRSNLVTGLSDFAYYLSDMMLNFLVVLLAFFAMTKSGRWQQINSRKFKGSYLFYSFLLHVSCTHEESKRTRKVPSANGNRAFTHV